MKKSVFTKIVLVILFTFNLSLLTFGQTPEMFKYQAVLRDASGNILANQSKTVVIDILQTSSSGTSVFTETHSVTTTAQGLINLNIGSESSLSGIDWSADEYFIQITVDGTVMGTSQLLSVPYALHAKTAENATVLLAQLQALTLRVETLEGGDTSSISDGDGNVYTSVVIGTQEWMVENLKTTKYNDGSDIPNVTDNATWAATTTHAYAWYNNNISNKDVYGALYNWYAVDATSNGNKNVCPVGWHVPTDAEWTTLTDYIAADGHSGTEGTALKATSGWNSSGNGTDNYGFTALPGGFRGYDGGSFYYAGGYGYWWSSTAGGASYAWYRYLYCYYAGVYRDGSNKQFGFAVRCLKDN